MGKWKITQRSCNSDTDRDVKLWKSLWKYYLGLWFWNFSVHWGPLEALFKYRLLFPIPESLIQDFSSGAWDLAFPIVCQMMLVLLIRGPRFENHVGISHISLPNLYIVLCVVCSVTSVLSTSLRSYRLKPNRFCKIFWVRLLELGCRSLLQGIFPTKGLNPSLLCLLSWRWILDC